MKYKSLISLLLALFVLSQTLWAEGQGETTVRYEYYPDGKVKLEIPMKGEKMEGNVKYFDDSGVLREEGVYQDGLIKGPVQTYDASGRLERRILFENNELKTVQKFDENGVLVNENEPVPMNDYEALMRAPDAVKFKESQE